MTDVPEAARKAGAHGISNQWEWEEIEQRGYWERDMLLSEAVLSAVLDSGELVTRDEYDELATMDSAEIRWMRERYEAAVALLREYSATVPPHAWNDKRRAFLSEEPEPAP